MKRILLTAGGTASAYYFGKMIRQHFDGQVHLTVADVNDPHLIAASRLADDYIKLPFVTEQNYKDAVLGEIDRLEIDVIVPLIDMDLANFPQDDYRLAELNCFSTAPKLRVSEMLSDKAKLDKTARELGIPVPKLLSQDLVEPNRFYFVKPRIGFGSRGTSKLLGAEILQGHFDPSLLIQELCEGPEVTVEVFCDGTTVDTLCRERIEVKAGVCTKARVYRDEVLNRHIRVIAENFNLPAASCFQFMKNSEGSWCLFDANLRIGAGSALSAAVGWNLPLASLQLWLGKGCDANRYLSFEDGERYVVRVFDEVVLG